jgi:c-di-GMP-binding flagellar brake protein YcgR
MRGVNPAIASACARNLPLDLRISGDSPQVVYRSRFLGVSEHSGETALIIEAPAPKGSIIPIRRGTRVKIAFSLGGSESHLETVVLDRYRHELNSQVSVASLLLRMPEGIVADGQRSYFRIVVPQEAAIELRLAILAEDEEGEGRVRGREKALITDLGGGGLGFCIAEGRSLLINSDTLLLLKFRLRGVEQDIRLLGRICFSLRQPERREAFFGVQFVDVESELEYKRSVDRILHFVAEEQRRRLTERPGEPI